MSGQVIALPAPEKGWALYQGNKEIASGKNLREVIGHRSDVIVGFPASNVTTFSVALPATDEALYESMIYSQIEKRGLLASGEEVLFDFEIVEQSDQEILFSVSVVSEIGKDLIDQNAAGYHTSAALRDTSEGDCLIWEERGRLVFAVFREEKPLHVQVLSGGKGQWDEIAGEIHLILVGLGGDPALSDHMPDSLVLNVDHIEQDDAREFGQAIGPLLRVMTHPCVGKPRSRDRLLPAAVTQARKKRRARSRNSVVLAVVLVAYVVGLTFMIIKSQRTAAQIESLERQISIVEPDVQWIQEVDQKWRNLEPAFEKSWFPVVQLSRITSALPGSGVVIREYRTSGRSIRVRGQARDVQLANRLLEDLQGMDGFAAYDWSMPNPKVEKNNTATFEIEGKPKNAGADS